MAIKKDALKANIGKSAQQSAKIDNSLAALLGSGGSVSGTKVLDLELSLLDFHPQQSHYSMTEDALQELAQSIIEVGVLDPILVQPAEDGRYRILAGHRRTRAGEYAGLDTIPAIIKDVDDDTATIIFNATNVYNRELLISERVYAYLNILEASQSLGAPSGRTSATIVELSGDSKRNVQRLLRLGQLNKSLLNMVDTDNLAIRAGVDLSYLSSISQENLHKIIQTHQIESISMQQAKDIRSMFEENGTDLTEFQLKEYFSPSEKQGDTAAKEKKLKARVIKLPFDYIADFFNAEQSDDEIISSIVSTLELSESED